MRDSAYRWLIIENPKILEAMFNIFEFSHEKEILLNKFLCK